uniref:Uncharacterized protein n=1 Tax=Neogobius melanostomus TaxID=47308 RepID=A0A8C6TXB1_9GOBI
MMASRCRRSSLLMLALLAALMHVALSQDSESGLWPRALRGLYSKGPNLTAEKQLLGELQDVLEKLQSKRLPLWEKKYGQVATVSLYSGPGSLQDALFGQCPVPTATISRSHHLVLCLNVFNAVPGPTTSKHFV